MSRPQASRGDWTYAALDALGDGGVAAVRVDVLARTLGLSRGSFYWHFKDRDALLVAALEEWERVCTTDTIAHLDAIADPAERLRTLLTHALDNEAISRVEPAIAAHADHSAVAPVLRRVITARIDFLVRVYRELGHTPTFARRQAVVAFAAYTGWLQLRSTAPEIIPEVADGGRKGSAARRHLADQLIHAAGS